MLPHWLRQFKKRFGGISPATPIRRVLVLEALEDRSVPATAIWTGGAVPDVDRNGTGHTNDPKTDVGDSGDLRWSNPANWLGGYVPDSGGTIDDVIFPASAPQMSINYETFVYGTAANPNYNAPNSVMDLNITISSLLIQGSGYEIVANAVREPLAPQLGNYLATPRTLTILGPITYTGTPDSSQHAGFDGALGNVHVSLMTQFVQNSQTMTVLNSTGTLIFGGNFDNDDPFGQFTNITNKPGTTNVGILVQGAGNLVFNGNNSFDGLIEVSTGMTLTANTNTSLGGSLIAAVIDNGATLVVNAANLQKSLQIQGTGSAFGGGAALTGFGGVNGGIALTPSATIGGFLTLNGVISGAGNLTTIGFITLTNANTYLGQTLVKADILTITNNDALSPGSSTTVFNGATLQLAGDLTIDTEQLFLNGQGYPDTTIGALFLGALRAIPGVGSSTGVAEWKSDRLLPAGTDDIVLQTSASIGADQNAGLILSGTISGAVGNSLTKYGQGQAEFPTANPDFHGDTVIQNGIVILPTATGLGPATAAGGANPGGAITVQSNVATNTSGTLIVVGQFTSQKNITLNGGGYSGQDPALLLTPLVGFISGQGALRTYDPQNGTPTNIDWTGTVTLGSPGSLNGATASIWTDSNSNLTIDGVISGAAGQNFQKVGNGFLTLTNTNTYLGTTTLRAGTTTITNGQALGAPGAAGGQGVTVTSPATLALTNGLTVPDKQLTLTTNPNNPVNLKTGSGTNTWTGLVNVVGTAGGEADITITDPTGVLNFTNVVSGDALLRKLGAGTFELTGTAANTFVGDLHVDQGTVLLGKAAGVNAVAGGVIVGEGVGAADSAVLLLGNSQQIPSTRPVTINSDGLFNLNNFVQTVGPLTIQGGDIATGASGALVLTSDVLVLGSTKTSTASGSISLGSSTRSFNFLPTASASLAASTNPAQFGTNVTFVMTVSANPGQPNPTGTVTFFDGSKQIGTTQTLVGGVATLTTNALTVGSHTISAVYSGDGNYATQTVILAQPEVIVDPSVTLSLSSNADPATPGQAVKYSVQVSASTGNPTPTGTVTFFDNGVQIGTAQTLAGGTAEVTVTYTNLQVGSHVITAVYSGDSTYSAASTTLANQEVGIPATMQLSSNADPVLTGSPVTFTFTATSNTGNPTPTGTVQFFDNGVAIGAAQTLAGGVATFTTSALTLGTHNITAQYSGDSVLYLPGLVSLTPTQVVGTTALMTLSSNNNQSVQNAPVTFTVVINGRSGAPVPSGSVQFFADGVAIGAPQILSGTGVAALSNFTGLTVGSHVITAQYSGDTFYTAQTATLSQGQTVVATPAPASGTISVIVSSSNNSSESGQGVTFTFTAFPASGGAAATGTVQFFDGTTPIGGPQTLVAGAGATATASITTASLSVGTHNITASYSGGNYGAGSFALAPAQVVQNPIIGVLSSSVNSLVANTPVTFTFTDTVPTGAPAATGTVTFFDSGVQIGSPQTLSAAGTASITTSSLVIGVHNITATFTPTGTFYGTATATLAPMEVVGTAPSLLLTTNLTSAAPGAIVTFHFTATGVTGGPGAPTGTVKFFDNGFQIGTAQSLILGSASISTNNLSPGSHVITAQYSGDGNYAAGIAQLIPNQVVVDAPSIQITTSANPVAAGSGTVTAHVTRVSGDPAPTGTVTFFVNGTTTQLGTVQTISAGGTASVSLSSLPAGTYSITAVYSGDANYQSESTTFTNLVVQTTPPPLPPVSPPPTTTGAAAPTLQVNGVISGGAGAGIVKTGVGQLILNNNNTYSGSTTVNGALGSIVLGVNNALPTGTPVTITAGTLNVNGQTQTVGSLVGTTAGTLALGSGTFIDTTGGTYAGLISGTGTLEEVGTGTLILTGASPAYTGTTLVGTGTTVLVNANQSGAAVTVQPGGTLGGTGAVGNVTVGAGGRVSPGTVGTVGTLSTGNITFSAGAVYIADTGAASAADEIVATGTATLNNAVLSLATGTLPTTGTVFTVLTASSISGTFKDQNGNVLSEGATFTVAGRVYQISYLSNTVTLTVVASAETAVLTSNLNPAQPGQAVTFTATYTQVAAGDPVPQGSVQFYLDGSATPFATVALNGSGAASAPLVVTVGTHTITAVYTSSNGFQNATSTLIESVSGVTSVALTTSSSSSIFGNPVTYTAHVTGAFGTPTGTVNFYNASTGAFLGAANLDGNGFAQLTTTAVRFGTSTILAAYAGDSTYRSGSGVVTQVITDVPLYAAGSGPNGPGIVTAFSPITGGALVSFAPFGAYAGGVKVAVGDVNGDGYADLIVMAGPGALNGLVQIYSGRDFSLLSTYFAFPGYAGEFNIAVGDLTGNGVADVIFSTATGGDFVFAYAGASNSFIVPIFSAFGGFTGGVTLAAGDILGNGMDQIIVGTASRVGAAGVFNPFGQLLQPYYFAPIPMDGVNVAAADLNGDGHADLIFGAKTNSTLVLEFDGVSQGLMGYFFAYPGQSFGVTVAAVDPTGNGFANIVTGFTGNVSAIAIYSGLSFQLLDVNGQPSGAGGVSVGGSGTS